MTPADALIEKMARAMFEAPSFASLHRTAWTKLPASLREEWRDYARAAYEAEHEETKG